MKDRIITNNIRNIKKSFPRFLSLLVMGALGVFAFAGLLAVAPDMINSLDRYLDDQNVYDIRIISDMGLDPEDVSAVEALPGIKKAEGIKYRDCPVQLGSEEGIVNISALPSDLNQIELTSGRLPRAKNEIVTEEPLLEVNDLKLGDHIYIDDEEGFFETDVVITGTVKSPLFYNAVNINNDRGVTTVGAGIINFYAYVPGDNFKADYYSVLYATAVGAAELTTGSDQYLKIIEDVNSELEEIREARQDSRYKTIMGLAGDKIDEESEDARKQLEDAAKQLEDAKKELDEAAKQIADGEKQLSDVRKELDEAAVKLEDARGQLSDKEKEFEEGKKLLEDAGRQIGEKEAQLKDAETLLADGLATLNDKSAELESGRAQLEAGKKLLDEKQVQADEAAVLIASGEKEVEKGAADLEKAKQEAAGAKTELDKAKTQIEDGEKQLEQGRRELDEGKETLEKGKEALAYVNSEYDRLVSLEHLTEDIINSEMERLKTDIDALRGIFEELAAQFRAGTISIESAIAVVREAIEAYTREPTVLERVVFYKVAALYLEPVIREGEETYNKGLEEYKSAEAQLNDAKKQFEEGQKKYEEGLKQIADGEKKLEEGRKVLASKKKEYEEGLSQLNAAYAEYESGMNVLREGEELLRSGYEEYDRNLAEYNNGKQLLESAKQEYLSGVEELSDGENLLIDARVQLEAGEKEYEEGMSAYKKGEKELEDGKNEYEKGHRKYSSGLAEYESGRADFDEEIRKAREGISELGTPTWYIYDRTGYQTYAEFFDDADSIRNLSRVFPLVFFMVAILVSLISMSRMVEMDRLEIGTLKSMGFSREKVITKYAFFSILATTIGSAIGSVLGLMILPTLIFHIYGILFDIPKLYLSPNWGYTMLAFGAVLFFVVGAGMLKAVQVMREKPADLLRPKSPKPGKRIIFEKIGPLWRRLKFSDKITVRNLFRYKKRLFVTVFGIMGCTALMLCGFGLKDAIVDIPTAQFGEVFRFDATCFLTGLDDNRRDSEKLKSIMDEDEITGYTESMRIKSDLDGLEINLVAFEGEEDIQKVFILEDDKTGEPVKLEKGKAVINGKLSKLTGLKAGDEISVTDLDHVVHTYTISGIVKNYFENYIVVDKDTLEEFKDYYPNIIYLKTNELDAAQREDLAVRLMENPPVLNVTFKEKLISNASNMLKSLDKVVLILIVLSALLSFVVLYNLSNININERRREIATLKVLGFYDKEVDAYINRENVIVTIVGIGLGLLVGIFLTRLVVSTVEIDKASFINRIKPLSYVYAAAMSSLFTFIVNWITHFNLKKINMIDSLKSVE